MSAAFLGAVAAGGEKGDVNADGKVGAADVLLVIQAVREEGPPLPSSADVAPLGAPDGSVDGADVSVFLRALSGEDLDGDALGTRAERELNASPFAADTGGDGTPDADLDPDSDGLTALLEQALGSSSQDGSGIGFDDASYNPVIPGAAPPGTGPVVLFYHSRPVPHLETGRLDGLKRLLEADGYQVDDFDNGPLSPPLLSRCPSSTDRFCAACQQDQACADYVQKLVGADVLVISEPSEPITASELADLEGVLIDHRNFTLFRQPAGVLVLAEGDGTLGLLVEGLWGVHLVAQNVTHTPRSCPDGSGTCPPGWSTFQTSDGGLLDAHPIVLGSATSEAVSQFTAFLGGAHEIPSATRYMPDTRYLASYSSIATLGSDAFHRVGSATLPAQGLAQGLAIETPRALCNHPPRRYYVSSDLEAFTALTDATGRRRGLQRVPGSTNQQLALNLFHSLDRRDEPEVPWTDLVVASRPCTDLVEDTDYHPSFTSTYPLDAGGAPLPTNPLILVDSSHANTSLVVAESNGFTRLLRRDGYRVQASPLPFSHAQTQSLLEEAFLFVVANPGPGGSISAEEFQEVVDFVSAGGSLLFVIDHAPVPERVSAAAPLLGIEFPVQVGGQPAPQVQVAPPVCFPYAPGCRIANIVYAREPLSDGEGVILDHPIANGRNQGEGVERIRTFGGSAFHVVDESKGDHSPVVLHPATAVFNGTNPPISAAGPEYLQGMEIQIGAGRVYVSSEAAMFKAQRAFTSGIGSYGEMGINSELGNQQLLLNVVHRLDGLY